MIRRDVFQYLLNINKAVILVQRNVRSYLLHKKFLQLSANRSFTIDILQRNARRWLAHRKALELRRQQASPWEQLWDSRYNRLYYYHVEMQKSQYEEPDGETYRPLIRDKHSAALMQAWPRLGGAASFASMPTLNVQGPFSLLCKICNERKSIKFCLDCRHEEDMGLTDRFIARPASYCLPCFVHEHPDTDQVKSKHRSRLLEESVSSSSTSMGLVEQHYLKCCMCGEPAVRKCLGPLDDEQIDSIYRQLQKMPIREWDEVLQQAHVGGERRIVALLEQFLAETEAENNPSTSGQQLNALLPMQLNAVRSSLERIRAECDECYCKSCYKQVHSGGKRALHRWMGFQEKCRVCLVCTSTPAEVHCLDCNNDYCDSCSKVFHAMGRKRKHKRELITDELVANQSLCFICNRRAAENCPHEKCSKMVCVACFEFKHKDKCAFNNDKEALRGQSRGRRSIIDTKCVVCGEMADKRCLQCGDLYCSNIFIDNASCFAKFHSKGNRASHTTETLINQKLQTARLSMKSKMAHDMLFKQGVT
jgi:hypothetical protein